MISLLSFIFAIGIAVLIHEFGHFIFAKRAGVFVQEFAIGMGPRILQTKKGETIYSLRLLPIGGFVAMAGEGIELEADVPKNRFIQEASWINKFLIFFMGAGFNFVLAIVLMFIVNLSQGVPSEEAIIGAVVEGGPADIAGIEAGDVILSIDGNLIEKWDQIGPAVDGDSIVKIERDGSELEVNLITEYSSQTERYVVGIYSSTEKNFVRSATYAVTYTYEAIGEMFVIIKGLISGGIDSKNLAGPVGIFQMAGQAGSAGVISLLTFSAFLSINLGFVNLIPIPAFDGGRILIILVEAITRRKLSQKVEMGLQALGLILILMLLVYVTFNDVLRIFN